jgi:glycoprotein 2-beta-D-xylosyltransferase
MGRDENDEFPKYEPGALSILRSLDGIPETMDRQVFSFIQDVLHALTVSNSTTHDCIETITEPTLLITRYEYVNLYHTMTDWFNTYFTLPSPGRPVNIVFLDAHAKGNLDSVWLRTFGNFTRVKQLPAGGVCFTDTAIIPPGYSSPLYPMRSKPNCPVPSMMNEFAMHMLTAYDLSNVQRVPGRIVIIDRVPYISHPRSKPQGTQRLIRNLPTLQTRLLEIPLVESVVVVQFEHMSFGEQLRTIREASVVIGNHGAGLTHLVFMSDDSHIVEFGVGYDFFNHLVEWKPNVRLHVLQSVYQDLSVEYIENIATLVQETLRNDKLLRPLQKESSLLTT